MNIEAFILVGGRSTRFGQDKFSVALHGETVVERAVATVRAALPESRIRLVAANDEQIGGGSALMFSVPIVFDIQVGRGPWGGLHAALAYAESEWVLVLACDYPLITSKLIKRLAAMIADDVDAVVPIQSDGRVQPLCAFYRVRPCRKLVSDILESGRPTPPLRSIFEDVPTRFAAFEDVVDLTGAEHFFLNMNTPADLQKAVSILDADPAFVAK